MKNVIKIFSIVMLMGIISCNSEDSKKKSSNIEVNEINKTQATNFDKFIGTWAFNDGPFISIIKNDDSTFVVKEINGLEYIVKIEKDKLVSVDNKGLFYKQELPEFEILKNGNLKFDCGTGPFELSKTTYKITEVTFEKVGARYTRDDSRLVGKWIETNEAAKKYKQGFELLNDGVAKSINMHTLLYKKWWIEKDILYLEAESVGNGVKSVSTESYAIYKFKNNYLELVNDTQVFTYERK